MARALPSASRFPLRHAPIPHYEQLHAAPNHKSEAFSVLDSTVCWASGAAAAAACTLHAFGSAVGRAGSTLVLSRGHRFQTCLTNIIMPQYYFLCLIACPTDWQVAFSASRLSSLRKRCTRARAKQVPTANASRHVVRLFSKVSERLPAGSSVHVQQLTAVSSSSACGHASWPDRVRNCRQGLPCRSSLPSPLHSVLSPHSGIARQEPPAHKHY